MLRAAESLHKALQSTDAYETRSISGSLPFPTDCGGTQSGNLPLRSTRAFGNISSNRRSQTANALAVTSDALIKKSPNSVARRLHRQPSRGGAEARACHQWNLGNRPTAAREAAQEPLTTIRGSTWSVLLPTAQIVCAIGTALGATPSKGLAISLDADAHDSRYVRWQRIFVPASGT